jgi:hypothetical protein
MSRRLRKPLVIVGVVASLILGIVSIQVAAALTLAAAPPPAPPISMSELESRLAAEQARAESLQAQLDDLLGVTGQLSTALSAAETKVSVDGLSAAQLRDRLKAAEARLKLINRLLKEANDRLRKLGAPTRTPPPSPRSNDGSTGGGAGPNPTPTAAPVAFRLTASVVGGDVRVDWTACTASGFSAYAVVRSGDSEIHYPPEDLDTVVARVSTVSSTAVTDTAAPSGKVWYRVWCLTSSGGETRTAAVTNTVAVTVP